MTITYPLSLPTTPGFRTSRFTARGVVAVTSSPFTGQQQVQQHQGMWWEAELTLPLMKRAAAEGWISFLLKLGGRYGTFLLGDPDGKTPRGTWAGTPQVLGAGQTGQTLNIDTLNNGATIKEGDYFQLGTGLTSRLYKVLNDITVGAPGTATLDIFPRLRESPADNALLTVTNPVGLFRLASNEMPWDADHVSKYGISFSAVEAF